MDNVTSTPPKSETESNDINNIDEVTSSFINNLPFYQDLSLTHQSPEQTLSYVNISPPNMISPDKPSRVVKQNLFNSQKSTKRTNASLQISIHNKKKESLFQTTS